MKKRSIIALALCLTLIACTTDQVLADLNLLIQIAGAIIPAVSNLSPADAAFASKISGIASTGLAVIEADYNAFKSAGGTTALQKVENDVSVLKANLNSELAAAHVSNPATVLKITNWVNLITTTLDAILAAFPSATNKAAKVRLVAKVPSHSEIKAMWQVTVCAGDANCFALVK